MMMTDTDDSKPGGLGHSFGFKDVDINEKQGMVNQVFAGVAENYDLMNDFMSGGMHRLWKDDFISWLAPPKSDQEFRLLDVAGGTGDITFRFLNRSGPNTRSTVFDISPEMLSVGQKRAEKKKLDHRSEFIEGNAEELPFPDKSFDAYTIAFGIRNVPRFEQAIKEAYRVLRPGGRFMCLEFSEVEMPIVDKVYDMFSMNIIPQIGKIAVGDADSYRYLVESIRKFPDQETFAGLIRDAGFDQVKFRNLSGGIAAMHSGWRL